MKRLLIILISIPLLFGGVAWSQDSNDTGSASGDSPTPAAVAVKKLQMSNEEVVSLLEQLNAAIGEIDSTYKKEAIEKVANLFDLINPTVLQKVDTKYPNLDNCKINDAFGKAKKCLGPPEGRVLVAKFYMTYFVDITNYAHTELNFGSKNYYKTVEKFLSDVKKLEESSTSPQNVESGDSSNVKSDSVRVVKTDDELVEPEESSSIWLWIILAVVLLWNLFLTKQVFAQPNKQSGAQDSDAKDAYKSKDPTIKNRLEEVEKKNSLLEKNLKDALEKINTLEKKNTTINNSDNQEKNLPPQLPANSGVTKPVDTKPVDTKSGSLARKYAEANTLRKGELQKVSETPSVDKIFVISIDSKNPTKGVLSLDIDASNMSNIINNIDTYFPHELRETIENNGRSKIVVVSEGRVELEQGVWMVKEKMKIKLV